ncbi:signal recognition particle subunit SRP68 [Ixodes scapularis]
MGSRMATGRARNRSSGEGDRDGGSPFPLSVLPLCLTDDVRLLRPDLLRKAADAQQKHGLRHGDYQRYRGYCSRRLRRLRKSLHFAQGSKHRYQGKEVTDEQLSGGESRFLLLLVVQCERAWAHAMQLRQEANTEPRKRFHLFARLKKAVKHAQGLAALCTASPRCDARCKLEAQAYSAHLCGTLYTEQQQWKEAMECLHQAQTIYEKLSQALGESQRLLYQQRVEELAPSLRYCAYNIGDQSAISDLKRMRLQGNVGMATELDHLIAQTREKQASSLSEVSWLGRVVPVRQEKVRLFLLAHQEAPKELAQAPDTEAKIAVHERLLMDCKDSLQLLREELRAEGGAGAKGPVSSLQLLHSYLCYLRQRTTVERNLLLIRQVQEGATKCKPQDLVRPYEIIVQNLSEMLQLPGVEEGSEFAERVQAELLLYKAHRVHHIGQALAAVGRYPETMALYRRGLAYVQQALAYEHNLDKDAVASLKELAGLLEGQEYSIHAQSILGSTAETPAAEDKDTKLLVDRLDTYLEDKSLGTSKPRLASFPPSFEPIACKPLFFDLALNHMEFPSLEDVADTKKNQGLTGLVKGWLGGWNK